MSVAGLAAQMGVAENVLARSIADWNEADGGRDSAHGRPTTSMVRIAMLPFDLARRGRYARTRRAVRLMMPSSG